MSTATTTDSADFYALEDLLDAGEQAYLHSGRDVMTSEVEPTVNRHWQRGSFPFEIAQPCALQYRDLASQIPRCGPFQ